MFAPYRHKGRYGRGFAYFAHAQYGYAAALTRPPGLVTRRHRGYVLTALRAYAAFFAPSALDVRKAYRRLVRNR